MGIFSSVINKTFRSQQFKSNQQSVQVQLSVKDWIISEGQEKPPSPCAVGGTLSGHS